MKSSESAAFHMWLIFSVSAGIIMAHDSWLSLQQPRLSIVDATAAFTKVLVVDSIWLLATIDFAIFTWIIRPTRTWRIHIVGAGLATIWILAVLVRHSTMQNPYMFPHRTAYRKPSER